MTHTATGARSHDTQQQGQEVGFLNTACSYKKFYTEIFVGLNFQFSRFYFRLCPEHVIRGYYPNVQIFMDFMD